MNKKLPPLVSVVMPVFNGEPFLREAINSILNQTFTNFEFLIINDGSTDKTKKIIESYSDSRICLINQKNIGLIKTLNKGIKLSRGAYIARMDADDISEINRLEIQFQLMERELDIAVCGSWVRTFGTNNSIWQYPTHHDEICCRQLFSCAMAHPSTMIRRSTLMESNFNYNENCMHAEDYDLWVKISKRHKLININKVLLSHRIHKTNIGSVHQECQVKTANDIRKKQLVELGIENSDNAIILHSKISRKKYEYSMSFVKATQTWLERLEKANKNKKLFNETIFKMELGYQWWAVCRTTTQLGLFVFLSFYRGELHKYINLSPKIKIIFFIKCMMRYG